MNVLVFGGAGFIGSYVTEELIRRNYKVTVADIKNNFCDKDIFKKCDILSMHQVNETISSKKYEAVYNFSGFASLDMSIYNPYDTLNLNISGNINILESCVKNKIKHYIYASSAYAMNSKGSFYGISKLTSEKIIEEYNKRLGLPYTIVRYGSVYSERPSMNNYLFNLVEEAINTKKINHEGDGEELREYIHAHDAALLSVDILENKRFINKHIILTGLEKIKRIQLFKMIEEILGEKIKINLNKKNKYHHYHSTPYQFQPTLSKKLTANPYIDMGQGILEIIKLISKKNND